MSRVTALILHTAAVAGLAGCASDEAPTWAELDRRERLVFMTDEVEPTMRAIFQEHDQERWASFGCESCHGADAAGRDYEMPAVLGALPLDNTLEVAEMRNPELTAFMLEEVFPTMAALLDEPKFDQTTEPDGFRCVGCHVVAP